REELMLDAAYAAWQADTAAGKTSLLVASDNETVQVLNLRAQRDMIAAGHVRPGTTILANTSRVGIGDVIVTRKNDRTLATAGGWVKNGDRWHVVSDRDDGSLMVQREAGGPHIALPAHCVSEHVGLGYAATPHRAQGGPGDTAHAL